MQKIKLAQVERLKATSAADGLELYAMSRFNPLRWIFIKRLKLLMSLFPERRKFTNLLEVGYGSGVLIPEFLNHCDNYYGVDIHENHALVESEVKKGNPKIKIGFGNICNTEFEDGKFDCITALSVLEHIKEIDKAVGEIGRILKKDGFVIVGFPIENFASNFILDIVKIAIGFDRKVHHPTNHRQILAALQRHLKCTREIYYPFRWFKNGSLFYCGVWKK